jgi:hypothetical protein
MNKDEISKILEAHKLWVFNNGGERADLRGAYLQRAYLQGADLQRADLWGAYLRGADLRGAYLQGAYLQGADLQRAYLQGADLQRVDLQRADLRGAYLQGADLRGAYLQGAYLRGAYLRGADLRGAYLQGADLQGADLQGADLWGADLQGAKNIPDYVRNYLSILPDEGDVIGWKKLQGGKIAKLLITTLNRSNSTNRKCRAEFAKVLNIYNGKKEVKTGYSTYNGKFEYKVGEIVTCDEWNDDWTVECGGGIHFFITRQEAEDYS